MPGGSETVTIAQRLPGALTLADPMDVTFDYSNAAGELTDVYQPAVADALNSGTVTMPHTSYTYDSAGNELKETDAKGNVTTFTYDQNGNQVSQTLPSATVVGGQGSTETWTYNANNQVATHTDFDGNVATYSYSNGGTEEGLLQNVVYTGASGSGKSPETVTYTYNDLNQQYQVTDASGTTTDYYDPFGNLVESDTSEGDIHYAFDPVTGNHTDTWTGNASHAVDGTTWTHYGYDNQGRLMTVTVNNLNGSALSTPLVTTYAYDNVGNKLSETLPDGEVTTYSYDSDNRLTGQTEVQPSATAGVGPTTDFSQSFSLNPDGTRASSVETQLQHDGSVQTIDTAWTYDAEDRLTGETVSVASGPDGLASGFTLPAAFNLYGLNQGSTVVMSWDGAGAYVSPGFHESNAGSGDGIALLAPTTTVGSAYLADGGNGTDWILVVSDGLGDVAMESLAWSNSIFTSDGVVTSSALPSGGSFDLDPASPGYSDVYSYDQNGNRIQDIHTGPGGGATATTNYTYNGEDELTSQATGGITTTNTYDLNGSLTSSTPSTGSGQPTETYTYDVRNKLVGFSNGTSSASYIYDDDGNRVRETTPSTGTGQATTYYLTDTQNPTGYAQPIEAKPSSTALPTTTYVLGDRVLAQVDHTGNVSYLLTDGHGSTQQLTGPTGVIVAAYQYDPFGNPITFNPGSAGTVFLFGGDAVYDPVSGLYLHGDGVRPTNGFLFIQMDSSGGSKQDPLSLHKYLYSYCDPVNGWDPSGDFTTQFGNDAHAAIGQLYEWEYPNAWTNPTTGVLGTLLKPDIVDASRQKYAEIKPFTFYGLTTGFLQILSYDAAFGRRTLGYTRDTGWPDGVGTAIVDGVPIGFFNVQGIIFYTYEDEADEAQENVTDEDSAWKQLDDFETGGGEEGIEQIEEQVEFQAGDVAADEGASNGADAAIATFDSGLGGF